MKTLSLIFILSLVMFFSACSSAYSSHHGDRAGRYNSVPYNNNYYYRGYRSGGIYMGRPYRRF